MRNRYILAADLPLVVFATYAAFVLRFDWYFTRTRSEFVPFLAAALLIKPATFYAFGMYRRLWRYTSIQDGLAILLANTSASLCMTIFVVLAQRIGWIESFPRSVIIVDWTLMLIFATGARISVRVVGDAMAVAQKTRGHGREKRVLVAGAGDAGVMVLREARKNPQLGLNVVGFLDDDPAKVKKRILGAPVFGSLDALTTVVKAAAIDEIIIAMPTAAGPTVRVLAERCRQAGVPSRILPGVFELLDGKATVTRLRHIEIADLLRRRQVMADTLSSGYLRDRVVLVTGGGGSIGFELCRQIAFARPSRLILVGHGENSIFEAGVQLTEGFAGVPITAVIADIRDRRRLDRLCQEFHPEVVFHAAAHKHVPLMELHPEEAVTNNILGTHQVVEAALRCGAERLILVSTDKAVSPTSVMGASKRIAEMIVRDAARRHRRAFAVVRFGNVLGSRGSVVPMFKRQIERGEPVTITHPDMKRFFMTIPEAVHLVLVAGGIAQGGELFALKMGDQIRVVDLAKDMIRLSGLTLDEVPIVFTGVRPGEKLVELLWEPDAVTQPTSSPDVLNVVEYNALGADHLQAALQRLEAAAAAGDALTIQTLLAECIPTFVPGSVSH